MLREQGPRGVAATARPLACAADYAAAARAALPPDVWDYVDGGAGDELTLAANLAAFRRRAVRPRVLVDVAHRDTRTRVLGTDLAAPLAVAPMAYHRLVHPDGESGTARAAAAEGLLTVASTFASQTVEEIAAAAPGRVWFQLYCFRDRGLTADLVGRAQAAGCTALVLTGDAPLMGRRERDIRRGFVLPGDIEPANLRGLPGSGLAGGGLAGGGLAAGGLPGGRDLAAATRELLDPALTWDAVGWLAESSPLPLVIKGVMTAEDAVLAREAGAAAVIVSNHGGRQLDGAPATLDALAEVCDGAAGDIEVYLDGGVRRGLDVLKAVALGARLVLTGRPVLWGLAVAGEHGAREVLRLLKEELDLAMALSGRPSLARLGLDTLAPAEGDT
ncbi:alpha-hydroxy acid oxidase [Nonomuraea soli]|uniref:4-hydroxymandelate oxidase n=1 Tax=Nonomuraea soli TaxID=1032476 RepID=A0A7W0CMT4_9ACTN|nr:alpha-hydroxy acid oxidase [Nonomuraea soli]MBA2893897.1 4-hydroxymandelate oxidase [Nonomuraea soli]